MDASPNQSGFLKRTEDAGDALTGEGRPREPCTRQKHVRKWSAMDSSPKWLQSVLHDFSIMQLRSTLDANKSLPYTSIYGKERLLWTNFISIQFNLTPCD
ncbi:hypothetical protein H0E87_008056 [Populus deltoides]|uniref:Uncharacterized protein n=1 Tax=Populus deltoides TaxID=3696 RepID=A0A8T2YZ98_POPDE|nr:hypothetical protein H0E87_008056 [Populus deltoides]